ncbi:SoxR reducing system RseC family protein [Rhabdochromatium marinum]|uniref:SoxR reducing system RseC family protein n=1 Tax=Rhabdochromatium marinum TaxID=48729 RepID=UPI001902F0BB|nr:SoxR reducing system RseC family protein [Rhabdochromatium marinum]MBK1649535.1 hypothetical protein [Rhabdochromatium marinum]
MIEQSGRVLEVLPADAAQPARLRIEVPRRSACGGCGQASGCGTAALAGLFGESALRLEIPVPESDAAPPLRAGDPVRLGIEPGALLSLAFLTYLLPVVLMLLGAGYGEHLGGDGPSLLLALLGLLGGLSLSRWLVARLKRSGRSEQKILASVLHARADLSLIERLPHAPPQHRRLL